MSVSFGSGNLWAQEVLQVGPANPESDRTLEGLDLEKPVVGEGACPLGTSPGSQFYGAVWWPLSSHCAGYFTGREIWH